MQGVTRDPPALGDQVAGWLARLLGSEPDWNAPVRLHVCSSFCDASGALRAIRIGPHAPDGPTDLFMLRAARAQADAIVTSGRIVRGESSLEHGLGEGALARSLHQFRRERLGRAEPPRTLVVSRSGDLPAAHPLWEDWTQVTVWTESDNVPSLRARLPAQVQVQAAYGSGLAPALGFLRDRGARRISLELGPRAMAELYAQGLVDELWLSRFEGPLASEAACGAWPFGQGELSRWSAGRGSEVAEASGAWHFERFVPR